MDDTLIWELQTVKTAITDLKDRLKPLDALRIELEEQVLDDLAASNSSLFRTAGTDGQGKRITVSVGTEEVANVNDWAEFEEYIYNNRALYLLQRRAANVAYRDEIKVKGEIPGVESFTKRRLSFKHV